jgi:hypothetical protein
MVGRRVLAHACRGQLGLSLQAVTPIRKRDGSTETHILDVIGPAIGETGVMEEFALFLVDFRGLLMVYNVFDLEPLDMSDRMLSALQAWQFSHWDLQVATGGECILGVATDIFFI